MYPNCRNLDLHGLPTNKRKGNIDPRCEQGVFTGYGKTVQPMWCTLQTQRKSKSRLVKFTDKTANEKETQTSEPYIKYYDKEFDLIGHNSK